MFSLRVQSETVGFHLGFILKKLEQRMFTSLALSPSTRLILNGCIEEAKKRRNLFIGSEHLLLIMLSVPESGCGIWIAKIIESSMKEVHSRIETAVEALPTSPEAVREEKLMISKSLHQ